MRETSIIITPVANGFTVQLPERQTSDNIPGIGNVADFVANLKKGLHGDDGEEWKQIQKMEEDLNKHLPPEREESIHVFADFAEVLGFLEERYINI